MKRKEVGEQILSKNILNLHHMMKLYFNNEKKNGVVSAENLMPNSLGLFYFCEIKADMN